MVLRGTRKKKVSTERDVEGCGMTSSGPMTSCFSLCLPLPATRPLSPLPSPQPATGRLFAEHGTAVFCCCGESLRTAENVICGVHCRCTGKSWIRKYQYMRHYLLLTQLWQLKTMKTTRASPYFFPELPSK